MILVVYRGWLREGSNGEEDGLLVLDDIPPAREPVEFFADLIQNHLKEYGNYLTVRYFVSNGAIPADQLYEHYLGYLYGVGDAKYDVHYSEITGYLWTDEDLMVGGHDLLKELKSHLGSFLHLEIGYSRTPNSSVVEEADLQAIENGAMAMSPDSALREGVLRLVAFAREQREAIGKLEADLGVACSCLDRQKKQLVTMAYDLSAEAGALILKYKRLIKTEV